MASIILISTLEHTYLDILERLSQETLHPCPPLSSSRQQQAALAHSDLDMGRALTRIELARVTAAVAASSMSVTNINSSNSTSGSVTSSQTSASSGDGLAELQAISAALAEVPVYASLFIHDLVNLGCACATHTLDDKRILSLQISSMQVCSYVYVCLCMSMYV